MQWLVTFCLTRFNTTTFECDASLPLNIIPLAPSYIGFDDVLLYSITAGSFISENCSIVSSDTTGEPDVAVVAVVCMFGCSWWKPFAVVMFWGKK